MKRLFAGIVGGAAVTLAAWALVAGLSVQTADQGAAAPGPNSPADKPGNPDPGPKAPPDKPGNPDPGPKAPPVPLPGPVTTAPNPADVYGPYVTDVLIRHPLPAAPLHFETIRRAPSRVGEENAGQVSYTYELPLTETTAVQDAFDQPAVRAFAGDGFRMPPMPPGAYYTLARHYDKEGALAQVTVVEPNQGFRATRHVTGGFAITITYGSAHQIEIRQTPVAGRPGWMIQSTMADGKQVNHLWVQDGDWLYQFQPPHGDLERLLRWAQELQ